MQGHSLLSIEQAYSQEETHLFPELLICLSDGRTPNLLYVLMLPQVFTRFFQGRRSGQNSLQESLWPLLVLRAAFCNASYAPDIGQEAVEATTAQC